MCIRRGGGGHGRVGLGVKAGGANRTLPIQDEGRERKWGLGQDKGSVKLHIRQEIVESCALDGEGYCIRRGEGGQVLTN